VVDRELFVAKKNIPPKGPTQLVEALLVALVKGLTVIKTHAPCKRVLLYIVEVAVYRKFCQVLRANPRQGVIPKSIEQSLLKEFPVLS
jgi:hypothetical protein